MKQYHNYHMVVMSPWPILMSIILVNTVFDLIYFFQSMNSNFYSLSFLFLASFQWWRDVCRESSKQGFHTNMVKTSIRVAMILFIISEVMFFLSFFWAFFNSSLSPNIELGVNWPPAGVISINPFDLPILNTIILLISGVTITLSHHLLITKNPWVKYNLLTIFLGIYFTFLQLMEYKQSFFSLTDSIYGNIFFLATGFHGLHVIVGSIFICVMTWRYKWLTNYQHNGLEMSIWYWHFVDVVWLFLFCVVYWWNF